MRFLARSFWLPKDLGAPGEYMDAHALDFERGIAAIADGVATAIYSRAWARIVVDAVVRQPPDLMDTDAFQGWLTGLRAAWRGEAELAFAALAPGDRWKVRPKLVDGAMTTLLWVELWPSDAGVAEPTEDGVAEDHTAEEGAAESGALDDCSATDASQVASAPQQQRGDADDDLPHAGENAPDQNAPRHDVADATSRELADPGAALAQGRTGGYRVRAFAIGDCCLIVVRDGAVVSVFPMQDSEYFAQNPQVVGSVDRKQDHLLEFLGAELECFPGDLLVLCTDAVGLWAMRRWEQGEPVEWEKYWDLPDEAWLGEIVALRRADVASGMRVDDTTLLLLRVVAESPALLDNADSCQSSDRATFLDQATWPGQEIELEQAGELEQASHPEQAGEPLEPAIDAAPNVETSAPALPGAASVDGVPAPDQNDREPTDGAPTTTFNELT